MRVTVALALIFLLGTVTCYLAVQPIDDLESTLSLEIQLDGSCCRVGQGSQTAIQSQAAPGEYIIPGPDYRTTAASGRMDSRELFLASTDAVIAGGFITTLTENGIWQITSPTPDLGNPTNFTSILTYDGNTGTAQDPFEYDRDILSLDLTFPGSFSSSGNPASLPPAYGFQLVAQSDLKSTFSFRVLTGDTKGSQFTYTIPALSTVNIFAPFYKFTPIPEGDVGEGGRGQHPDMSGEGVNFKDVTVISFIFEVQDAVDATLSIVSLITGVIKVRVYLDCTGNSCAFDGSDTIFASTLTISGTPLSALPYSFPNVAYSSTVTGIDAEGFYSYYVDEGTYTVCVTGLPSGVTFKGSSVCTGKTNNGCYTVSPLIASNNFADVIIDVPLSATLSIQAPPTATVTCVIASTATSTAFTGTATASGCSSNLVPTFLDTVVPGCSGERTITRVWTVTQGPQSVSTSQTIFVDDDIPPIIGSVLSTSVPCGGCTSTASNCLGAPTVTDSCALIPITPTQTVATAPSSDNCIATYTRTWRATDPCGNVATPVLQTFTVFDGIPPTFIGGEPADGTVPCGAPFNFANVAATDSCQVSAPVSTTDVDLNPGSCTVSRRRIFTANDGCGNTATVDQILTANSAGSPILNKPADAVIECTTSTSISSLGTATAIDSCTRTALTGVTFTDFGNPFSGNPPYSLGSGPCPRSFQRVWSITTSCGGTQTVAQTITVRDTTNPFFTSFVTAPPAVTCPSTQCTCSGAAPTPIADDLCSNVSLTSQDFAPSGDACQSQAQRLWTAQDACGNRATAIQILTRADQADPILTLPFPTITYPCNGGFNNVQAPSSAEFPSVIDCQNNVSAFPRAPVLVTGQSTACAAVYTRIWDAADGCGNDASISQTVIVRDTTAPIFTSFPTSRTVDCLSLPTSTSTTIPSNIPLAADNCSSPRLGIPNDTTNGSLCPGGILLSRTWTATDDCGLSTSNTQLFTITNTNIPSISVTPSTLTVPCDQPDKTPTGLGSTAVGDTACDINSQITFFDVLVTGCPSVITRTFVITDACDRSNRATQTIRLTDSDAPQYTFFPDDVEISCADSDDPDEETRSPTISDNCDVSPSLTFVDVVTQGTIGPGLCPGDDVTTRTWYAVDDCGNTNPRVQTITISNRPPDECDPVECIPQPCDSSSCPVPNCDCCGAPAVNCLPVNCNPQPCNPVDCTPVPCSGCDIDIAVTGCQPRTCPPRYVYVDDDDVENFQKAQPAQANPKVSGASQLVLSCMLLLASVGSIFVALF